MTAGIFVIIIIIIAAMAVWAFTIYYASEPMQRVDDEHDRRELDRELQTARRNGEWLMRKIEADRQDKEHT